MITVMATGLGEVGKDAALNFAQPWALARQLCLTYREKPDAVLPDVDWEANEYARSVLIVLQGLHPSVLARLRHPARSRCRILQQKIIVEALT